MFTPANFTALTLANETAQRLLVQGYDDMRAVADKIRLACFRAYEAAHTKQEVDDIHLTKHRWLTYTDLVNITLEDDGVAAHFIEEGQFGNYDETLIYLTADMFGPDGHQKVVDEWVAEMLAEHEAAKAARARATEREVAELEAKLHVLRERLASKC